MSQSPLPRGILVAIEGIDGAGKTTQVGALARRFEARGWPVITSKEPTTGPWGQLLRQSAQQGRLGPDQELDAFIKDRREHVANLISPALADRKLVILDRYYYSTIAYQGILGRDPEEIRRANEEFAPRPDLLVVLDVNPAIALDRVRDRGDEANHFEKLHLLEASREIFWRYVHDGPREAPDGRPCWAIRFNAEEPPESLTEQIDSAILQIAAHAIAVCPDMDPDEQVRATAGLYGHVV